MTSYLKLLSLLSDQTRLRIISILEKQELSVAEIQETLHLGQSRISAHLRQLRESTLLHDKRDGQRTYYSWNLEISNEQKNILDIALKAAAELPTADKDKRELSHVLEKRKKHTEAYFNALAGRLGKRYCPGRSWEVITHLLSELIPHLTIADLGAGEGLLAQLLAKNARKVIAIDNSPSMVEVGSQLAEKSGLKNLEYRLGDLESPPISPNSVDLVILCQALHHATDPPKALKSAYKILRPSGKILILDLNSHNFQQARQLYADNWLGFSETQIKKLLKTAGFTNIHTSLLARESEHPHFQSLLASALKVKK